MKTIQQDLKSNNLSVKESIDVAQNLETDVYIWCYTLLMVLARKEEEEEDICDCRSVTLSAAELELSKAMTCGRRAISIT